MDYDDLHKEREYMACENPQGFSGERSVRWVLMVMWYLPRWEEVLSCRGRRRPEGQEVGKGPHRAGGQGARRGEGGAGGRGQSVSLRRPRAWTAVGSARSHSTGLRFISGPQTSSLNPLGSLGDPLGEELGQLGGPGPQGCFPFGIAMSHC